MKKSNLLFSAVMALAMGSLASCSSDDLVTEVQGQETTVDHDQVRYLNVTIASAGGVGTRAETTDNDFLQGDEPKENFIENMTFVFYDAAGVPTGQAYDLSSSDIADEDFESSTGSVGKIWKSIIPVSLVQGQNLPSYVMCFINPVGSAEFTSKPLSEIEGIIRQEVVRGNGNFPMTNSVYYGDNPITGETKVRMIATPVNTGQLYTSEEAAKADGAQTINIYVERYAARVTLNLASGTDVIVPNATDVNGYTLTFVPEFWRPNAIDQNIFAVKRYGLWGDGNIPNYNPTFAELQANFKNKTWWNEPEKSRSYWACSPSYYDNEYPKVSDDITDIAAKNDYTGTTDEDKYPYTLHYFNYNQIEAGKVEGGSPLQGSVKWENGFSKTFYARETTTAAKAWGWENTENTAYNPLASIASAVIVGHYELEATGGSAAVPEGDKTFYLYGKTEGKWNLYFESSIVGAMVKQQSVVLKQTAPNTYEAYREEDGFIVEHPSKSVRDIKNTTVAGRLVALQLDPLALPTGDNGLFYYDVTREEGDRYVKITAGNVEIVNSNLLSTGYASKYGDGIGYFNIPIEHLGGAVKTEDGKSYNFAQCPPGSFGIVRNHAYTINVNKISGLATPLRDKMQPIVPPVDEVSYYISARLNILNWRIVPTQDVEL